MGLGVEQAMRLALDAVFPYRAGNGARSMCRIRVYEPNDERDDVVVVASELARNTGASVTNAAEVIAAEVTACYRLPTPLTYIEHYPPESTDGRAETFDLVVFGHWDVREIALVPGELVWEIGPPEWRRIDRQAVEILVAQALAE